MSKKAAEWEDSMTVIDTPPSIVHLVSVALRRKISTGRMKPGPIKISQLAAEFRVSPSPVREALRQLESEGLVTFSQHRGVVLNALSLKSLQEIFEVRLQLEPLLLQHAVPMLKGNLKARKDLERYLAIMDAATDDNDRWRDANSAFHLAMYEYADTPYLRKLIISSWTAVEPYLRLYVTERDAIDVAQSEHKELLNLVLAGEAEQAAAVLRQHLTTTMEVVEVRLRGGHVPRDVQSSGVTADQDASLRPDLTAAAQRSRI